jgi:hypothetical protein
MSRLGTKEKILCPQVLNVSIAEPCIHLPEWSCAVVRSARWLDGKPSPLNLSFGGKIYESPVLREESFADVVGREAFSPH